MLRPMFLTALLAAAPAAADEITLPVTAPAAESPAYKSWVFPKFDPANAIAEEKLTAKDLKAIEGGEVVVRSRPVPKGQSGTHVVAFGLVDASPAQVFAVVMDCAGQLEFVPHLEDCKNTYEPGVEPATATRYKQYQKLKFGFGFVSKEIKYTNNMFALRPHVSGWVLDKGDIEKSEGYWRVIPYKGKTLLLYDVFSNPGMAVPDWVQEILVKSDLPATVEAFRDRAQQIRPKAAE